MSRTIVTGRTFNLNPTIRGTEGISIPKGTTAERPTSPAEGIIRYNSTTGRFEGYSKNPNDSANYMWTTIGGSLLGLEGIDEAGIVDGGVLRYDLSSGNFVSSGSFSKIKVSGQTDVLATTKHDLEFAEGSGIILTTDPSNGKITIATTAATNLNTQYFTGDGNTSSFTLNQTPPTANDILVFVDNLYQDPQSYSLTSNTLNFTANIPTGQQVVVTYLNLNTQSITVADGAITSTKVANSAFHIDTFYGDGVTTEFTLSQSVSTANQLFVTVGTDVKNPGLDSDYGITGTNNDKIKFTYVPSVNAVIKVRFLGVTTSTTAALTANSVGITELNVTDGSNGQVLTTNGAGTLSFADVSASLNTLDIINNNNTYTNPISLEFDSGTGFTVSQGNTGVLTVSSQASFSTINVTGSNAIVSSATRLFELEGSSGINISSNNTTKKITFSADYTTVGTNLVSTTDNTYDIGSSSVAWKDIYVNSIKSSSLVLPSEFTIGTSNTVLLKATTNGLEVGQKITIGTPAQISANEHVTLQATAGKLNIPSNNIGVSELNLSEGNNGEFIKTNGAGTISFGPAITQIDTGAGLTGGPITTTGTISLSTSFNTQLANGSTAYGWGNHASAGYLTNITSQNIETLSNLNLGTLDSNANQKAIVYNSGSNAFVLATMPGPVWTESSNNIYYTGGKVGTGISTPSAKFHISNQAANDPTFQIDDGTHQKILYIPKSGEVSTNKAMHIETDLQTAPSQPTTGGKIYFKNGKPYYVSSTDGETLVGTGSGGGGGGSVSGIESSADAIAISIDSNENVTITGNLTVAGSTTTINSTTLQVDDKNIELAHSPSGSVGNDASIDGGGITLKSSDGDKTISWTDATNTWNFNQGIKLTSGNFTGDLIGNATTATSSSTVTGAEQTSITSVGILTGLTVGATPQFQGMDNLTTQTGTFTVANGKSAMIVGPVNMLNVTIYGHLNVLQSFNVTGDMDIGSAGSLNIIG